MDTILYYICVPLGWLMKICWYVFENYGLAIILFTLMTKIILLPLSVWIQKNSILMVKIQPEINFLKVKYYGDFDTVAEEQAKLFKREKYHPMLSLIPLIIQFVLLMGVVQIIYHPMGYLFGISDTVVKTLGEALSLDMSQSSFQLQIVNAFKDGTLTAGSVIPGISHEEMADIADKAGHINFSFLGLDITKIPTKVWGVYVAVPLLAAASSWVMCFTQNMANVIQHEQSKISQYGLMAVSVGISLYLGCFVPTGIALYWIASNLMSVALMYALNFAINPKKYVDYAALEKSRQALSDIESLDAEDKNGEKFSENKRRERTDYKRFFKIVNKHVVIYSEKSGFYKYYEDIISELLKRSNLTVHYVTNDPDDVIFEIAKTNPKIQPYYIGLKKTIPLMMKMESDMVLMTTPDLGKFYIKRSFIKKDVEYVYVPHDMMSVHLGFRNGAFDNFDTIFCTGPHIVEEHRKTEEIYNLNPKKLVEFGYPLAEKLISAGERERNNRRSDGRKEILIAPSWNEDNLLDSCIDGLVSGLYSDKYHITIRPHPEYVKRYAPKMKAITEKYADMVGDRLTFELDFSSSRSIYASDIIITDWSGVGPEFAFATERPALFINTKLKCLNPDWQKIGLTPVEISLRDKLGKSIEKDDVKNIAVTVEDMLEHGEEYAEKIREVRSSFIFNLGHSAEEGAKYILSSLMAKRRTRT